MKLVSTLVVFAVFLVTPAAAQADCAQSVKTPFKAVALFKPHLLGRLENQALSPETDTMPVYNRPSGKVIADLKITYAPGSGITAAVFQGTLSAEFQPPVYDQDWGYGPWFHATLLDQQGNWQKIVLPLVHSGWIELPHASILSLAEKDTVYSWRGRHVVIIQSGASAQTLRDEQPSDMWCDTGTPPPLTPFKEQVVPLNKLYDDKCNLLLAPAYTRGC